MYIAVNRTCSGWFLKTRNVHAHVLPQPMRKQSDWSRSCARSTDCTRSYRLPTNLRARRKLDFFQITSSLLKLANCSMHGGETLYTCVIHCFHDDHNNKYPQSLSLKLLIHFSHLLWCCGWEGLLLGIEQWSIWTRAKHCISGRLVLGLEGVVFIRWLNSCRVD